MKGLGGNGSTFLCRALAAMENVVLLSETNPRSANLHSFKLNPAAQIARNYASLGFQKYDGSPAELGSPGLFRIYITALSAWCREAGKHLVVRDYSYIDFIGVPFVWLTARRSSLDAALGDMQRAEMLLLRHPIEQFWSLRGHRELRRVLDGNSFLAGYSDFLDANPNVTMFKYEDTFENFDRELPRIATVLGVPFDANYQNRLSSIDWNAGHERGLKAPNAETPRRLDTQLREKIREVFIRDKNYGEICRRCGYEE
jgi:hypothetical protein